MGILDDKKKKQTCKITNSSLIQKKSCINHTIHNKIQADHFTSIISLAQRVFLKLDRVKSIKINTFEFSHNSSFRARNHRKTRDIQQKRVPII